MIYKKMSIAVCWCLMLLPASIFAQKNAIKSEAEPSGKAAIQAQSAPSSPAESESRSYSEPKEERVREPREPRVRNEESTHTSYEAPAPRQESPSTTNYAPKPRPESSTSSYVSPKPIQVHVESSSVAPEPKSTTSPRPNYTLTAPVILQEEAVPVAPAMPSDGSTIRYTDNPLSKSHDVSLPLPLGPGDAESAHGQGGAAGVEVADSLPPRVIHGVVLSAPGRPNYNTLNGFPKPITGIKPVIAVKPVTAASPPKPRGQVYVFDEPRGGSSSDPYYNNDSQTPNYFNSTFSGYNGNVPELMCLYGASDSLVGYYGHPQWCVSQFDQAYEFALRDYLLCYQQLRPDLREPWMWPCYLTFEEEFQFWSEECAGGDPLLAQVRDLMRGKAMMVSQLLIDVDVTDKNDWAYVESAFAAPAGGRNYYAAMRSFGPDSLLPVLKSWVQQYPTILNWPSYVSLQGFYVSYYRSDIWLMLRTKAMLDYNTALGEADSVSLRSYAENAAWLCLALSCVDRKDGEVNKLKKDLKDLLRQDPNAWKASPLRSLME